MAGNDQNLRQRPTPKAAKAKPASKCAPKTFTGRERTNAGGYASGGESKAMVNGPSQIFKDNRRS